MTQTKRLQHGLALLMLLALPGCTLPPAATQTLREAQTLDGRRVPTGRTGLSGFRHPASADSTGIYMLSPWQRGKIPVVLIHGPASDSATWDVVMTGLQSEPDIQEKLQVWVVHYATGEFFIETAAELRRELIRLRKLFESEARKITVRDGKLTFMIVADVQDNSLTANYVVTPRGDRLTGKIEYEFNGNSGEIEVSGKRSARS